MKFSFAEYRFVLHWKWLAALVLLLAIGVTCVMLALWQLGRYDRAEAHADLVQRNFNAAPLTLATALPQLSSSVAADDQYRPVRLEGEYLVDETVLARNRPLNSRSGFYVVVPFRTDSGVILVNRGWVSSNAQGEAPRSLPAPPPGKVSLVARLEVPEETLDGRTNPPGQVQSINVPVLAQNEFAALKPMYVNAFVELVAETPAPAVVPTVLPMPSTDLGPHLGYAWQWYVFAAFFPLGWFVQARREAAVRRETARLDAGELATPVAPRAQKLRLRDHFSAKNVAGVDEFEEDALIGETTLEPGVTPVQKP